MSDAVTNPWATQEPADTKAADNPDSHINAWDTPASSSSDWLNSEPVEQAAGFDLWSPFVHEWFPMGDWIETGINWLVENFRPLFQAIRVPVEYTLTGFESILQLIPASLMVIIFALLAWQVAGKRLGLATFVSMILIGAIGAWEQAMVTLSLVLTSVFFCMLIGIPTGIWIARSNLANRLIRPLLDAMQTTPAFVYLVPIVMLFGIGNVPGVVVTIIFALPPVIRLTSLGIRQVPDDLIEASTSFGASPSQLLFKVQLPLAMPTIMAGVNQTLMLALSMVVIASMIAVEGLGLMVLRGIGRLDMGLAAVGGIGIVILAIVLDRITQALGEDKRSRGVRHWYQTGPASVLLKLFKK